MVIQSDLNHQTWGDDRNGKYMGNHDHMGTYWKGGAPQICSLVSKPHELYLSDCQIYV